MAVEEAAADLAEETPDEETLETEIHRDPCIGPDAPSAVTSVKFHSVPAVTGRYTAVTVLKREVTQTVIYGIQTEESKEDQGSKKNQIRN